MLIVQHDRHVIRVATDVDADGDLHIFTTTSGLHLTPTEQDQLIQHLIEVRGAGRVQALLNQPWDGSERRSPHPVDQYLAEQSAVAGLGRLPGL